MKTLKKFSGQIVNKQNLATVKGGCTMEEFNFMIWHASKDSEITVWYNTGPDACYQSVWMGWDEQNYRYIGAVCC